MMDLGVSGDVKVDEAPIYVRRAEGPRSGGRAILRATSCRWLKSKMIDIRGFWPVSVLLFDGL